MYLKLNNVSATQLHANQTIPQVDVLEHVNASSIFAPHLRFNDTNLATFSSRPSLAAPCSPCSSGRWPCSRAPL